MAGTIIADKIQTENSFLTLNVGQTLVATINSSGILNSSGGTMIGANGSVSNTAITGNIISSQISPSVTLTTPIISGNLNLDSAGTTGVRVPSANIISFHTAGTEDMRIDATGNVGIGTASPNSKLTSQTATTSTSVFSFATQLNNSWADNSSISALGFHNRADVNANGVGGAIAFSGGGTSAGSGNLIFCIKPASSISAVVAPSDEKMRISSAGLVGINEASPATLLHMTNGTLRIDGTTAQAIYIRGAATIKPYISINEFGTRQWDIGAGYYSAGTFSIQSNQTNGVYLGGTATSWASASDERLKDIIEPIDNALTKVNGLRSVIGKYKTDEEGVRRSFLIAQDIQTQFPEALESSDSERLGVQYTDVIPLLVASIKELKAINDTQAETINALTARMVAVESK